jgi:glycosyltransferase involved in cell wall biosynthesis
MEILAPIHEKGLDSTYEMYKNYTYRFETQTIFISDMPAVKDNSNSLIKHLSRLCSEWRILKDKIRGTDLVYIFMSTFKAVMAVRICLKLKKPFAVYSGNDWKEDAVFQYKWDRGLLKYGKGTYVRLCGYLEKWVMRNSPAKIVNSQKQLRKYGGFPGHIIKAKPIIQIKPEDCFFREDTCKGDVIRIISVAAVIPRKGLEYLIEGFTDALVDTPNMELHLVGTYADRNYKAKLDSLVFERQVASKVIWRGYVPNGPELLRLYRQSDIFVLSSLNEGFPRVIWEAMSQGLPVIATGLENIRNELPREPKICLLISPGDPSALKSAILYLIESKECRMRLINNSQSYISILLEKNASNQFVETMKNAYA